MNIGGDENQGSEGGRPEKKGFHPLRFFRRDLWQVALPDLPLWQRVIVRLFRFITVTWHEFHHNRCLSRASGLAYTTILALVPALALAFSLMKGFGAYDYLVETAINPALDQVFGPSLGSYGGGGISPTPLRSSVDELLSLAQRTDVFGLGVVGLLLLLYTVVQLLGSIEETFNHIWGVHRARSLGRKMTDYMALFFLTPIFILAATFVTAAAQNNAAVTYFREQLHLGMAVNLFFRLIPLVAGCLALTILYAVMPNRRISLRSAVMGGVIGGTLWQLLQWVHVHFQIGVARYNAIYAGFAAIPVFLAWIYLSWVAILLGSVIAYVHQNAKGGLVNRPLRTHPWVFSWRMALSVSLIVAEGFRRGTDRETEETIASKLGVPTVAVRDVLSALVGHGILARTSSGRKEGYLPATELDRITLKNILEALGGTMSPEAVSKQGVLDARADRALAGWFESMQHSDHNTTLAQLLDQNMRLEGDLPAPGGDPSVSTPADDREEPEGEASQQPDQTVKEC
ncbi:MAG: YihY family inner membrane protein [Bradymonadales bacterium]|nr:YihY family inner membrane protein [Bradymonadales bacterium]